ncbi:LysR family transcriptional regulator [Fusibacter sp. 3D3]|uniref:LysR family transcriptional regulator n=1 Tax=Fusibacter sp. 3D3 TaxID=1048380 RepID=UPI000852FC7E|nr:LysR family transcriptional regulator [Fusibacter sp. 3D3]GAU76541.1 transcriptional regulator, LysR family [Fusibacter sp. 3D3]
MEIKQLEYFIAVIECKSLNKAAERLYTSQPNVSKVLKRLETELGTRLVNRTSKGVVLTGFGDQLYEYSKNIMKTVRIVEEMAEDVVYDQLKVATFPSNMISRMLTDYYMGRTDKALHIKFLNGTVEKIVEYVHGLTVNIGVVFYPEHQERTFNQILNKKNLIFHRLRCCKVCIYAGPAHDFYSKESLKFSDLENLRFVQGSKDYFSMMEHVEALSNGVIKLNQIKHIIHTNSDHMMMNMLKYSDLCTLGIDFMKHNYHDNEIKKIAIEDSNSCIKVGYMMRNDLQLSSSEIDFIRHLRRLFESAL